MAITDRKPRSSSSGFISLRGQRGGAPGATRDRRARRGSLEVVRHPDGPVEIKLSGIIESAERRVARWRALALGLIMALVVGASATVVFFVLRWDSQQARTIGVLRADLEFTQARSRCWEMLARYAARTPQEIIPEGRKSEWVSQCVSGEFQRLNRKD
ncbi:MAG TPA: hypothetical protein VFN71_09490 [Methylomirabilota bacterium]|nr:hypothetical protein [Methylomirabilota bacterium]